MADFWRSELDPERVMRLPVTHWQENTPGQREELLTVEEPFEIRLNGQSLAMIMRTPGNDVELALGFLLSEGIIRGYQDIDAIEIATDEDGLPLPNVVNVSLKTEATSSPASSAPFQRHFAVSASCGLCGKNSISDLLFSAPPLEPDQIHVSASTIYKLPTLLRSRQDVFEHTGGLHAAGLFTTEGELALLREDVGRHNAVDKLVGHGLLHGQFPFTTSILMVSGRTSFEILQKALLARIPCVVAISAPSSMAVELAERGGITLIGFLRSRSMNVYTHPEQIVR